MPFKSEKQRKYLWVNEPKIAKKWTKKYGKGAGGVDLDFNPDLKKPDAYTPYAAGMKRYGSGLMTGPHKGGGLDPLGYRERDMRLKARNNALLSYIQANGTQDFASPNWLGYPFGRTTGKGV